MQNLWLKRCSCGKTAVEFRSRKDIFVDSVKHLYCPKCIKNVSEGSLIVNVKKWGSSTAKESDRGLYGILYNKEAIQRRNKEMGWSDEDMVAVFETGMVRPNLLSSMRDGLDFQILGVFKVGENIADYKKKSHKAKDADVKKEEDKEFDGKFYDSSMEEPLDRIAGKLELNPREKADALKDKGNLVLDKTVNSNDEGDSIGTQEANDESIISNIDGNVDSVAEKVVSDRDVTPDSRIEQTEEQNKSEILALGVENDPVIDTENNPFASNVVTEPSDPIFPNKSNE